MSQKKVRNATEVYIYIYFLNMSLSFILRSMCAHALALVNCRL